jgi:hypothetical protein
MRIIADITDPDIIQKILGYIDAQPPPRTRATAIQSKTCCDHYAKSILPDLLVA